MKQNSNSESELQLNQITLKKLKISKIYFQATKNIPIIYTSQYNQIIKKLLLKYPNKSSLPKTTL